MPTKRDDLTTTSDNPTVTPTPMPPLDEGIELPRRDPDAQEVQKVQIQPQAKRTELARYKERGNAVGAYSPLDRQYRHGARGAAKVTPHDLLIEDPGLQPATLYRAASKIAIEQRVTLWVTQVEYDRALDVLQGDERGDLRQMLNRRDVSIVRNDNEMAQLDAQRAAGLP